ncbi:MAG: 16S rRNA (cytidine(1402)-2'-O)-methyltransferase [Pelagibacterales bacterium]|nr:16S rRNA (cytidine(1402)-2'-O)-methyltransferase [Pelagibacterales bacterium]
MIPLTDLKLNKFQSGLYIVATPIGNLSDITIRALEVLKISDYVLCEDTRVSRKLLDKFKIKANLISNHKFNEKKILNKIINLLEEGKIISLISDAGTPCISDPGGIIVRECIKKDIQIFSIPGPSSVTAAVAMSGFTDRHFFYGFFPEKNKKINKDFKILAEIDSSIVFFISAKKFVKIIPILKKFFLDRKILICKEITKLYEEYIRFDVSELDNFKGNLRGEITLVLSEQKDQNNNNKLDEIDKKKIRKLIKKLSIKDVVEIINENKNISKKKIYNFCLTLKNEK